VSIVNQNLKVLLVGGYPPPYGGVTVHIQRLHRYLTEMDVNCTVLNQFPHEGKTNKDVINLSGNRFAQYWKMRNWLKQIDAQIVHFHFSKLGNFLIGGRQLIKTAGKAVCLATCHSGQFAFEYVKRNSLYQKVASDLLRAFDHLIAVNREQVDFYKKYVGIDQDRISLIPTFIPPLKNQIELSQIISDQVAVIRKSCKWILMVSGFLLPYYGFDLLLKAVDSLEKYYQIKFGLIFVFYTKYDENYRKVILSKIESHGCCLVYNNIRPEEFLGLLSLSDIFIRPTLADSFGVSVAEALFLKIPVVASDVCIRQDKAVLFKTGDLADLVDKIKLVIDNYTKFKARLNNLSFPDNAEQLYRLYKKLTKKRKI